MDHGGHGSNGLALTRKWSESVEPLAWCPNLATDTEKETPPDDRHGNEWSITHRKPDKGRIQTRCPLHDGFPERSRSTERSLTI